MGFITDTINKLLVEKGAKLVTNDEFLRRKSICEKCPNFEKITVKGFKLLGCNICGCPLDSKGRIKSFMGDDEQLKIKNLVLGGEKEIVISCPHPDGNKWL